jgi:hypothetical protein
MATNTIAGCNLAQIAQESLPFAASVFAPLNAFVTDFSADVAANSASVTTRIPTRPTAVDLSGGYTQQDTETTAKTITLNQFPGFVWGFNDLERSKSAINLNDLFVQPALTAVGAAVFEYIWNLVTSGNFATSTTIAAANFDRDDLADISATLTGTKKAPKANRSLIVNPTYYASLVKTLNSAEIPGITAQKEEGVVPRVAGFDIYESDLADGNSANLTGFAAHRSSLIVAARAVDSTGFVESGGEIADVVVPGLNLPLQWRRWYNHDEGVLKYSLSVLFGASAGTDMGVRIVSA